MSRLTLRPSLGLLLIAAIATTVACSEPTIDPEDAARFVDDWAPTVDEQMRSEASRAAASEALSQRLSASARAAEGTQTDEPPFERLVKEVYAAREYQPALVDDDGLTPAGQAIWDALQDLVDHRLDPEPYRLDAIESALATFEERRAGISDFDALKATDAEKQAAKAWLVEQPLTDFDLIADNFPALTRTVVEDTPAGERLQQALKDYQDQRKGITEAAAEIEHRLAVALTRYAREQRHFRIKEIFIHPRHWDFYNEPDVENSGRRPDPARGAFLARQIWRETAHLAEAIAEEEKVYILHGKIRDTLAEVLDSDDPATVVAQIPPLQPQYAGLVAEHRRYREIVANGGWEEVPRQNNLRPGQNHATVEALKRRLQAEGYYPADAPIDDSYDDLLTEAIEAYQETHQMQVSGRPHNIFWFSLNIPAERRLAQIGLNIERWRETNVRHELPTYTFVNVADFTVELYHEQERLLRHRTVVGDNVKSVNPLTHEEEYSNRTPTPMAAYIDRVIFNPYWNVTDRIRAVRILPEVRASLEGKYASRLASLIEQAERDRPTRVSAVAALSDDAPSARPTRPTRPASDEAADSQESAEDSAPEAEPEPELTEEERRAQRRAQALERYTNTRRVPIEGADRSESRRVFNLEAMNRLKEQLYGDAEDADSRFWGRFPYLDRETGLVDVENTQMDNVPSWYEANGYDVVRIGTWEYVRMLPGPANALGDVKIIFPNYDNIYLHDTPAKELFNRDVRGFSHGCIRVQDPLDLSAELLRLGGIEDVNIDRILADGDYMPIFLDRQIPVYLEYYTVRVDDEGRANFLADIYGYDAEALADDS